MEAALGTFMLGTKKRPLLAGAAPLIASLRRSYAVALSCFTLKIAETVLSANS